MQPSNCSGKSLVCNGAMLVLRHLQHPRVAWQARTQLLVAEPVFCIRVPLGRRGCGSPFEFSSALSRPCGGLAELPDPAVDELQQKNVTMTEREAGHLARAAGPWKPCADARRLLRRSRARLQLGDYGDVQAQGAAGARGGSVSGRAWKLIGGLCRRTRVPGIKYREPIKSLGGGIEVTEKMQVQVIYAESVIGPTGARIDYIHRASRSSILINDLEGDAMSIEINGSSATDVQIAEQLIKASARGATKDASPFH